MYLISFAPGVESRTFICFTTEPNPYSEFPYISSSRESFVGEASNADLYQLVSLNSDLIEMDSLPLQGHLTRDMLTVAIELEAFLPIARAGSGGWGAEGPWLDSWEPAGFALTHVLP